MKKPATLLIIFAMIVHTTNGAFTESKIEKKTTGTAVFTSAQQKATAEFFVTLSRKEFEEFSGRRLNLGERIAFALLKNNARRQFKRRTTSKGFNAIGFFASFLLGVIGLPLGLLAGLGFLLALLLSVFGVAGTYIFSKDKNMHKWAWIGFGVFCVGLVVLIIIIISSGDFG